MNVLLVEDEPRVADFIDRALRAENDGVTVASSGSEGVDLAKTGEFDVIVLDLMLPDMHGYDVCQRLRLEGDHTPILMLTAMDALEDKIKVLKLGADDYLTKPFDLDERARPHRGPGAPLAPFRAELEHLAGCRSHPRPRAARSEARQRHHQAHRQGARHSRAVDERARSRVLPHPHPQPGRRYSEAR